MMSAVENGSPGTPLLEATLPMYQKPQILYKVQLFPSCLTYVQQTTKANGNKKISTLNLDDIIGCDCMKGRKKDDKNAYVTVYAYPHKKKFVSKKTSRQRQTIVLSFSSKDSYEGNNEDACKWRDVIKGLLGGWVPAHLQDLDVTETKSMRLLVLVNPFAGPGKALTIFQQRVVPVFAEAGVHFRLIVTDYRGHARKIMNAFNPYEWNGIVIVSGDGLVYEVVNGLMDREDWDQAIKVPLGVLPGGSGNALSAAVNYSSGEPFLDQHTLHASYVIVKHKPMPMDLVAIDTMAGRTYSFLAVAWGIISDVDIESERYRSLGSARFTVGAAVRIIGMRRYQGRLSFLPVGKYTPPSNVTPGNSSMRRSVSQVEGEPRDQGSYIPRSVSVIEDSILVRQNGSETDTAGGGPHSPSSPVDMPPTFTLDNSELSGDTGEKASRGSPDNSEFSLSGLERISRENSCSPMSQESINPLPVQNGSDNSNSTSPRDTSLPPMISAEHAAKVPTPLLPPLDQPLPEDWVTIEGEFVFVAITYQTHLATDMWANKDCKLNDGLLHIGIARGSINRSKALKIMMSMEDGKRPNLSEADFEIIQAKAFRLVPITPKGHVTVDGELVDYGPIQGQILPGMARIMTLPPKKKKVPTATLR